jgi:hypothetical protein
MVGQGSHYPSPVSLWLKRAVEEVRLTSLPTVVWLRTLPKQVLVASVVAAQGRGPLRVPTQRRQLVVVAVVVVSTNN